MSFTLAFVELGFMSTELLCVFGFDSATTSPVSGKGSNGLSSMILIVC